MGWIKIVLASLTLTVLSSDGFVLQHHHHHHTTTACDASLPRRYPSRRFASRCSTQLEDIDESLVFVDQLLQRNGLGSQSSNNEILESIDRQLAKDSAVSRNLLPVERDAKDSNLDYEWIEIKVGHELAIQSLEPILNETAIATIRKAAEQQWADPSSGAKSRFTYQRPGNYEAHVSDLGAVVYQIMDEVLANTIYPLVRSAFFKETETISSSSSSKSRLCVYDALIIRYNATEAQEAFQPGAGQPLHRDLGIASINIMLNAAEEFQGGGTFFENQLLLWQEKDKDIGREESRAALKPFGPGHCLAHFSSERHAGASTRHGVRDIMVIFVTADGNPPPNSLRNILLKQCRDECAIIDDPIESVFCRIQRQALAIQACPQDGEAFQYLGTTLMDYAALLLPIEDEAQHILDVSIELLKHASQLTPCDSRVYNNLAIALSRKNNNMNNEHSKVDATSLIIKTYQRGLWLLEESQKAGCDVGSDLDSIRLNFGLYLSNQDAFKDAVQVLEPLARKRIEGGNNGRFLEDAYRLWRFCDQNSR